MAQSRGTEGRARHARHAAPVDAQAQGPAAAQRPEAARATSRHAAHAPVPQQQDQAPISQRPRTNSTGYVPQSVPVATSTEQDAPRPIGVDPAATGSFQRITAGQGATMETRDNVEKIVDQTSSWHAIPSDERRLKGSNRPSVQSRQTRTRSNRKLFVGIAIAVVVVVVAVFFGLRAILGPKAPAGEGDQPELVQTSSEGTVTSGGTTYALRQQPDGKYALVSWPEGEEGAEPSIYFEFDGTPVKLILFRDAIIIPENTDGGWDVIAYTMGGGSVGTQVVDADGNPVQGQGQIQSADLQDVTLTIVDSEGGTTRVTVG